jgi:hypothetical protein
MAFIIPAWEERPFCDCEDRCKIELYLGLRFYFCPALHPDFEVIVNLLLPILNTVPNHLYCIF